MWGLFSSCESSAHIFRKTLIYAVALFVLHPMAATRLALAMVFYRWHRRHCSRPTGPRLNKSADSAGLHFCLLDEFWVPSWMGPWCPTEEHKCRYCIIARGVLDAWFLGLPCLSMMCLEWWVCNTIRLVCVCVWNLSTVAWVVQGRVSLHWRRIFHIV